MISSLKHITLAAVLKEVNQPLIIVDAIVPELKPGQLLVKLSYAGVCHSQVMEVTGQRGDDKYLPHMLGHEGVGTVVDVGEGVTKVAVNDQVILGWIKGEGIDAGGCVYQSDIGDINAGAVTTFSTYAVVSENRVVKKPEYLDNKVAVLFGCALPTGAGIVLNQLKPSSGSTVGVFGLGGIGLSALLALQCFDLANIVAFDIEPEKLKIAKALGATKVYQANQQGIDDFFDQFPEGLDAIVESAGKVSTIETAFSLIRRAGGRCIFASHPAHGEKISIDPFELICGKQIEGSWGGASKPDTDVNIIAEQVTKLNLPIEKLLSNEYSLFEINQAISDLQARKITRALINLNK